MRRSSVLTWGFVVAAALSGCAGEVDESSSDSAAEALRAETWQVTGSGATGSCGPAKPDDSCPRGVGPIRRFTIAKGQVTLADGKLTFPIDVGTACVLPAKVSRSQGTTYVLAEGKCGDKTRVVATVSSTPTFRLSATATSKSREASYVDLSTPP